MGIQSSPHGEFVAEGHIGSASDKPEKPCDCFGCTQRRLFYCDDVEARLTTPLPRQNSPSSWKLH